MSDEVRNNIRPDHDEVELTRDMTLFQILMIGVGAMIGAGIFVLTGTASGEAGPAVLVAFLLNGIIAFMTGSIYAELGAMMPAAGGGYVWIHRSIGGLPGFLAGWISWFGHSVACSLYAVAFAHYTAAALAGPHEPVLGMPPEVFGKVAAVFSIALFGYINFRGASETGKAEAVVTIGKLVVLGLFVLSGFLVLKDRPHWQQQFQPFAPHGLTGIFGAMGVIFIAFQGYEIVAQSGEEVVNPKRNVPKAILWSVGVVLVVYLLVAFVSIAAVTGPEGTPSWRYLDSLKELGIVEAARQFMIGGPVFGRLLLLIGGLFSTASALNATIYSSSRVAYAMSRDANLPDSLSAIHPATRTPHVALVVSLVIIAAMAILLPLETVASAADIMFLLLFVAIAGVALVLRKRRPDADRAFKAPWFPVLPIVAVLCQFGLAAHLFSFSPISWLVSGGWLVAGGIIFFTYSRRRQLARAHTPVAARMPSERPRRRRVLVPLANPANVENLTTVGAAVAKARRGMVVTLNAIRVPEISPLESGRDKVPDSWELMDRAADICGESEVPCAGTVRICHKLSKAMLDTVEEELPYLVLIGWAGWDPSKERRPNVSLDPMVRNAPCDVAVLRAEVPTKEVSRVIAAVTGSPQAELTVSIATAVSDGLGVPLELLHYNLEGDQQEAEDEAHKLTDKFHRTVEPRAAADLVAGLRQEVRRGDLLVFGTSWESLTHEAFRGSLAQRIADGADSSILMVRRFPGKVRTRLRELVTPMHASEFEGAPDLDDGEG